MSKLCFCTEKHEIMTLVDNHVQLRDVLGRLGNGGVSVKVVNNELRIQRVDTWLTSERIPIGTIVIA